MTAPNLTSLDWWSMTVTHRIHHLVTLCKLMEKKASWLGCKDSRCEKHFAFWEPGRPVE